LRAALKNAGMVSKTSILAIVLLFGLILSSKKGNILQGGAPSPVDPSVDLDPVGTQINFFQTQIKDAMSFLKSTFKAPPDRTNLSRAARFQTFPRGSRFGTNPFTGLRIALPVGPRGSSKTESFFGGAALLQSNQNLINQGLAINKTVTDFIAESQTQIQLLEANTAV